MDIKGVIKTVLPFGVQAKAKVKGTRAGEASDRDANGQQSQQGQEQPKRNLTPEEIKEAVSYLEGLSGVKDNNLVIRLDQKDGINTVYVEDRTGKVIRRIPESELSQLTKNRQKPSGHLLNRAM